MERIIVRRGRFLTYELLRRTFGNDPNIEIIWDRRRPDSSRDVAPVVDRRGRPPDEWFRLDYLFTTGSQNRAQPRQTVAVDAASDDKPSSE
jgi:hypothetical protein